MTTPAQAAPSIKCKDGEIKSKISRPRTLTESTWTPSPAMKRKGAVRFTRKILNARAHFSRARLLLSLFRFSAPSSTLCPSLPSIPLTPYAPPSRLHLRQPPRNPVLSPDLCFLRSCRHRGLIYPPKSHAVKSQDIDEADGDAFAVGILNAFAFAARRDAIVKARRESPLDGRRLSTRPASSDINREMPISRGRCD